jgi:hypothetical protein
MSCSLAHAPWLLLVNSVADFALGRQEEGSRFFFGSRLRPVPNSRSMQSPAAQDADSQSHLPLIASASDAVDGSSTGTEVPWMWVLLRPY